MMIPWIKVSINIFWPQFQLDSSCCGCDTITLWDGGQTLITELDGCDDPTNLEYRAYSGELWLSFNTDGTNVKQDESGYRAIITKWWDPEHRFTKEYVLFDV